MSLLTSSTSAQLYDLSHVTPESFTLLLFYMLLSSPLLNYSLYAQHIHFPILLHPVWCPGGCPCGPHQLGNFSRLHFCFPPAEDWGKRCHRLFSRFCPRDTRVWVQTVCLGLRPQLPWRIFFPWPVLEHCPLTLPKGGCGSPLWLILGSTSFHECCQTF